MTLAEYRAAKGLTVQELADQIGKPPRTVYTWLTGQRRPHWHELPGIIAATNGEVTANDFVPKLAAS